MIYCQRLLGGAGTLIFGEESALRGIMWKAILFGALVMVIRLIYDITIGCQILANSLIMRHRYCQILIYIQTLPIFLMFQVSGTRKSLTKCFRKVFPGEF
ncbi:hypothetical protein AHAS_Ahas19G0098400 [Arachis hypogaea]